MFNISNKIQLKLDEYGCKYKILNQNEIFDAWKVCFTSENYINSIIKLWRETVPELSDFIDILSNNLVDACPINIFNKHAIVYLVNIKNEEYIYIGFAPKHISEDHISPQCDKIQTLLHDGFFFFPGFSCGPLSSEQCLSLNSYEWEYLEENFENYPFGINLCDYKIILSNAGGVYMVCNKEGKTLVWYNDEEPDAAEFWPELNEFMIIGMTN
ncbi:hypothetical protein NFHSH190041_17030 [Shewanella sp. NFH-SH190041]|uniref:hypothetical protein n=1 Tax=Shewanella sp. NFH-SH190041 TaxID=2950245 RepID=UPI0021C34C00|nr:hypothetical protein [Shewanella sp. NFH-SH190041]BDM64251.1 hypothetical protein NFHSH190041_17030 [Shewanella sp. NFH-SH190041]